MADGLDVIFGTTSQQQLDFLKGLTDDKCDPELGVKVHEHLLSMGLEHPFDPVGGDHQKFSYEHAVNGLIEGVTNLYEGLGLNLEDPSLRETPKRFACMMVGELTKGLNYRLFPKATATPNDMQTDEMVLVTNIQTISLCEHHLQTIDGVTHIAYIPDKKLLGLSKFARITDFFARRPQVQERMTNQIHAALQFILETDDVAVVQVATHYCMKARGAMQSNAKTTTSKLGGRFLTNPSLKQEMMGRING